VKENVFINLQYFAIIYIKLFFFNHIILIRSETNLSYILVSKDFSKTKYNLSISHHTIILFIQKTEIQADYNIEVII